MLKNITFLHFITTFHNFALKIETGELQEGLNAFWELEMLTMYDCIYMV